jgi:uracil-DNA glycosylase
MTMNSWEDLSYWSTGEWDVVQEKLNDMDSRGRLYNPKRELMFAALDATPLDEVKVAIVGQDPYPERSLCTGIAFSVPGGDKIPPTLSHIFDEYCKDLGYGRPRNGDLTPWTEEGVLLWNAIPSCQTSMSMSHDWDEWSYLTKEIVIELSNRGIVFIFMGGVSRRYTSFVGLSSKIIETSHPSPRVSRKSWTPFTNSRIFSKANDYLVQLGKPTVNWKLP